MMIKAVSRVSSPKLEFLHQSVAHEIGMDAKVAE